MHLEPEQRLRPQHHQTPRAVGQDLAADDADIGDGGEQQRIAPGEDADGHAGDRAGRGGPSPQQAAEERRRELRHRGEGEEADRGELRLGGGAVVEIGQQQDHDDRGAAHLEQQRADVGAARQQCFAPLQHPGHHDVVRHHDGERDRFHDHHGGRRRQAADEGEQRERVGLGDQRQRQHEHVAVDLAGGERQQAGHRDRQHEQVDQHEIEREQPGRALDLGLAVVLHHRDVELPGQHQDRDERQQRHGGEGCQRRLAGQYGRGVGALHRLREQCGRPVEHPERHEDADGEERDQLDDRFRGDRQHQSILMLGGVDVTGAEQHGERCHRQRDEQRDVAEHRLRETAIGRGVREDGAERRRHRFELERDVGDGAEDGDQRDGGGHRLALAVARGDEVGDRRDVLRFGEPYDAQNERQAEPDHQDGADVNGQKVEAGAGGEADRSEERPRGAVDRERKRVDQQSRAAEVPYSVAIARHDEQQPDVTERHRDDDPALQHVVSRATQRRSNLRCRTIAK